MIMAEELGYGRVMCLWALWRVMVPPNCDTKKKMTLIYLVRYLVYSGGITSLLNAHKNFFSLVMI